MVDWSDTCRSRRGTQLKVEGRKWIHFKEMFTVQAIKKLNLGRKNDHSSATKVSIGSPLLWQLSGSLSQTVRSFALLCFALLCVSAIAAPSQQVLVRCALSHVCMCRWPTTGRTSRMPSKKGGGKRDERALCQRRRMIEEEVSLLQQPRPTVAARAYSKTLTLKSTQIAVAVHFPSLSPLTSTLSLRPLFFYFTTGLYERRQVSLLFQRQNAQTGGALKPLASDSNPANSERQ